MTTSNIVMVPTPKKPEPPKDTDKCDAEDALYCKKCGNIVGIRTIKDTIWTIINEKGEAEMDWDGSNFPTQADVNCEECAEPMSYIDITGLTIAQARSFLSDETPNKERLERYALYDKEE